MQELLNVLGPNGLEIAVLGLVFLTVVFVVFAVAAFGGGQRSLVRRALGQGSGSGMSQARDTSSSIRVSEDSTKVIGRLAPLQKGIIPQDPGKISTIRKELIMAGFLNPSAVPTYFVTRFVLSIGLPIAFLLVSPLLSGYMPLQAVIVLALASAGVGLIGPRLYVDRRARGMQVRYREGFPDSLDLLVTCVEAGLSLDAAIERMSDEIRQAHPHLSENYTMLVLELRAGRSRKEALENLADRLGIDEARNLVILLVQSEELGSSVAEALRVYSDEMRVKRMLRAEEKAMALPVKLTIPLGLFVFPTMLVIIMLPLMIRMIRTLN